MLEGKNLIILTLSIVCLLLIVLFVYSQFGLGIGSISTEKAKELVLNFVNENILQGLMEAEIIGDVEEEQGLYKLTIKIEEEEFPCYLSKDGKLFFPQAIEIQEPVAGEQEEEEYGFGDFIETGEEICTENEKPIVYFFGSEWCSHCQWEHPIIEKVAEAFEEHISFHNNMDSEDDSDIFNKYSTGGVPLIVLGCKYYRLGSGERFGEESEEEILNTLICDLTKGQPENICSQYE